MIGKSIKISLLALSVGAVGFTAMKYGHDIKQMISPNFHTMSGNVEENEASEGTIEGAMSYYHMLRANLITGKIDPNDVYASLQDMDNHPRSKTLGSWLQWQEMGPDNISGRARGIVIDKDSQNVVYAGGVSGGFWTSRDGGSTWKRTGGTDVQNINISCMTQAADGAIYYGTGEEAFVSLTQADGNSGFLGRGVFKSTDRGQTFKLLSSTDPGNYTFTGEWSNVSRIKADPTNANKIYVANNNGVKMSTDGGNTWVRPNGLAATAGKIGKVIEISPDGNTIFVAFADANQASTYILYRSTDGGSNFSQIKDKALSPTGTGIGSSCSYELAIAPSNSAVVYISSAAAGAKYGQFEGLYRSEDNGTTWTALAKSDANGLFNPFAQQGYYDNCIAVDPKNADHIIFGGLNLWEGKKVSGNFTFNQLTNWSSKYLSNNAQNPYYVHADQHTLVFDKQTNPALYIGSDGGIAKSADFTYANKPTFFDADYGMSTIQFYGVGVSYTDKLEVIGGAQDNGTIHVNKAGITLLNGTDIKGGDGGFCEISMVNPNFYFGEYVYGDLARSFNKGTTWAAYNDNNIPASGITHGNYGFITPFRLWESLNDLTAVDTAIFIDLEKAYNTGDVIVAKSRNGNDLPHKLTAPLPKGTAVKVQDVVQAKLYTGTNRQGLWMTPDAVVGGVTPTHYKILNQPIIVHDIETSADGNTVFVSGYDGQYGVVWRVTGLSGKKFAYDSKGNFDPNAYGIKSKKIFQYLGFTVSIDVDQNDPNHVLVGMGGYGTANRVYVSTNAMDTLATPSFSDITNDLPKLPVYDVLINMKDKNTYLLATEFGIWASKNGGSHWEENNLGMERVPVFQLRQRKFVNKPWNGPVVYAATHGRGVFFTETFSSGINPQTASTKSADLNVNLYPNPVHDFANISVSLPENSALSMKVYDLQGKMVEDLSYSTQLQGEHSYRIEASRLPAGTYFVKVNAGVYSHTAKMLVVK